MVNRKMNLIILLLGFSAQGADAIAGKEPRVHGSLPIKKETLADFPKLAKISSGRAAQIAAAQTAGEVLSIGLENEDGFLVYAAEIVRAKDGRVEVLVDAGDGKVLSTVTKSDLTKEGESED